MLNLREFRSGASRLADWLPWACLVGPGIVLNKDGSFQRTIRYRGPDLDSATEAELMSVTSRVNNVLKRFGAGWALFFDATRVPASSYPRSKFPDAVSWLVDEERRASFEGTTEALAWDDPSRPPGEHFESISYLTLMYLPPAERVSRLAGLFFESSGDAVTGSHRRSKAFGWRRAERSQPGHGGGNDTKDDDSEPQQDTEIRGNRGGYREHLDRFVQETDRAIDLLSSCFRKSPASTIRTR
jgi:type IV secretory pathway VirB4 component